MIEIINKPIEEYLDLLTRKEHFSFSRYWDGELSCIVGRNGTNCDGCAYLPDLRFDLQRTILNNYDYYHALYFPSTHSGTVNLQKSFEAWLLEIKSDLPWYDFMVWQRAVESGRFFNTMKVLNTRNVIFVGGSHLRKVGQFLKCRFIEVPQIDAYESIDHIKASILLEALSLDDPVIIFCAGMASNIIIDELFQRIGDKWTMIDMGSVWDAILGLKTRQWIRKIPEYILNKNRSPE